MASVRKPICKLLRKAESVVGPAMFILYSVRMLSKSPGVRNTSAYKLSKGRKRMAKSVVLGASIYLLLISAAHFLMPRTNALRHSSMPAASAASYACSSNSKSSLGNLESMGSHTGWPVPLAPSPLPGSLRQTQRVHCRLPLFLHSFAYWSGVSVCSNIFSSWYSPNTPRVFTLLSTRLRSPTPVASCCISPKPLCTASRRSLTS